MITITIRLVPNFILSWWRYKQLIKQSLLEPTYIRIFNNGEYGWDYRYNYNFGD